MMICISHRMYHVFRFSLWWQKKGSGNLTTEFNCDKIDRFCRALIAVDKPKIGAKDLWDYASHYTSGIYNNMYNATSP